MTKMSGRMISNPLIDAADVNQILQDLDRLKKTLGDLDSIYNYSKRMAIYWSDIAIDIYQRNKELRQVLQEIKDELFLNGYDGEDGYLTKTFSIINRILGTKIEVEDEYDGAWIS